MINKIADRFQLVGIAMIIVGIAFLLFPKNAFGFSVSPLNGDTYSTVFLTCNNPNNVWVTYKDNNLVGDPYGYCWDLGAYPIIYQPYEGYFPAMSIDFTGSVHFVELDFTGYDDLGAMFRENQLNIPFLSDALATSTFVSKIDIPFVGGLWDISSPVNNIATGLFHIPNPITGLHSDNPVDLMANVGVVTSDTLNSALPYILLFVGIPLAFYIAQNLKSTVLPKESKKSRIIRDDEGNQIGIDVTDNRYKRIYNKKGQEMGWEKK